MANSCYNVFQSLLRSLCLKEFPCGFGSWRNPDGVHADSYSAITTADYGADFERLETLQKYLKSGTWDKDTTWSEEAEKLENLAVTDPKILTGEKGEKYILGFFKSLRLINKEIDVIDSDMVLLRRLESLTLSVNQIREIPAGHLPKNLKVLEVCMNLLEGVSSLCKKPPPLQHLGLSYNQLHDPLEYKYFTATYWPQLLSLDLSYNNLDHLVELLDHLATLPKLKSLVLQGNPFSVIPGYRGYTLDVLRDLIMFDDAHISADEKHRFKGLARKKENIRSEAHFIVSVNTLGGVPMPEELKENEDREEFPIVTSQYLVRYTMLENQKERPGVGVTYDGRNSAYVEGEDKDQFDSTLVHNDGVKEEDEKWSVVEHETPPSSWSQWIEMNYEKHHVIKDLRSFRDFLKNGMRMWIVHKVTKSWPVEETPEGETPDIQHRKSPMKGDKKEKGKPKKSAKGKKRGAEPTIPLKSEPAVLGKIGVREIPLSSLLDGGNVLEDILHCGGGPMLKREDIIKMQETDRQQAEVPTKSTSKKKSRSVSGGSKGKDKKVEQKEEEEVKEELPPRPITLQVKLELRKWSTAVDSQLTE